MRELSVVGQIEKHDTDGNRIIHKAISGRLDVMGSMIRAYKNLPTSLIRALNLEEELSHIIKDTLRTMTWNDNGITAAVDHTSMSRITSANVEISHGTYNAKYQGLVLKTSIPFTKAIVKHEILGTMKIEAWAMPRICDDEKFLFYTAYAFICTENEATDINHKISDSDVPVSDLIAFNSTHRTKRIITKKNHDHLRRLAGLDYENGITELHVIPTVHMLMWSTKFVNNSNVFVTCHYPNT